MSVNSKMTAIADQIRALLGLTGTMGLDEMATHLGTEQSNVTAALAAIADKGVTVPDGSNSDSLAALIAAIEAGGGGGTAVPVSMKDVNFYDYDGTLVASYTLAEAQALTALPEGPTHDGLIFQGWNWTLEKINALTRPMNVGAMYITDDGKTRLHIRVWDKARSTVPLYFSQTVANGVTIDWGDGSAAETISGTGNVNTSHAYGAAGDYTISLAVADGCVLYLGTGYSGTCVMGPNDGGLAYCNLLQSVNLGVNTSLYNYYSFAKCYSLASVTIPSNITSISSDTFRSCYSLVSITIPINVTYLSDNSFLGCNSLASISICDGIKSIGKSVFQQCYSLASITIPDNVTSIGGNAFYNCYSLASITIPEGITTIDTYLFSYCQSLASITIPDSVTSIKSMAFYYSNGMAEYHLKPTTPPTLASTNAFTSIQSDCIIYVPQGCLEAYQNATNWSAYASYMQEEPA